MRKLLIVNYIQKEATKQNEDIINLQPKNTYKTNQKPNSNRREGILPILGGVIMMGIGCLRNINTQFIETLKKNLHTKQISSTSITRVRASNFIVQHLS